MSQKVVFVLGQPAQKKHSVQFKMLDLETAEGWDPEAATTPGGWRPTFYIPKPFGQSARKLRVTIEAIDD